MQYCLFYTKFSKAIWPFTNILSKVADKTSNDDLLAEIEKNKKIFLA